MVTDEHSHKPLDRFIGERIVSDVATRLIGNSLEAIERPLNTTIE